VSATARVLVDPATVPMSRTIERLAPGVPVCVVSHRALADLVRELGSERRAARWLARLAGKLGRPVLVNAPTGPDTSSTVALAPRGWGEERLAGWMAGHHEVLEAQLGPIVRVGSEFPAPGRDS
jgi:hypothetical protein